ncbi:uncharacterized protein LOC129600506 [Paramacrobiotus metropolitanus]|uniref:uncharacterized protein LOC129600506 n=1 Tax=Paramacrobiotus metropolitanus TaxID=2943436 RepID=UPI00244651B8|nr:uncharacterized protein LOC129600506 [Paramacrobiotus metropolitanus]
MPATVISFILLPLAVLPFNTAQSNAGNPVNAGAFDPKNETTWPFCASCYNEHDTDFASHTNENCLYVTLDGSTVGKCRSKYCEANLRRWAKRWRDVPVVVNHLVNAINRGCADKTAFNEEQLDLLWTLRPTPSSSWVCVQMQDHAAPNVNNYYNVQCVCRGKMCNAEMTQWQLLALPRVSRETLARATTTTTTTVATTTTRRPVTTSTRSPWYTTEDDSDPNVWMF